MSSASYFRQLLLLVRLPNSFTVIANVVAAYIVGAGGNLDFSALLNLLGISLCFYHGGIVHNDCVDIDEDLRTQAHRPLASGAIPLAFAWALACYLFILGLLLTLNFDQRTIIFAILLVACILAYNFSSRASLLGCVLMGLCRSLNWLMVLAAVGAVGEYAHYAFLVGMYAMALTFLSRDENYAQKKWLMYCNITALLLGSVIFLLYFEAATPFYALKVGVFLCGLAVVFYRLALLFRHYTKAGIRAAVMFFILGMIPLDACLVFMAGYPLASVIVLLLIVPGKLLARKLYVT